MPRMEPHGTDHRRACVLAAVFAIAALGAAFLGALHPSAAYACAPASNPDGSFTCSQTYSDIRCPAAAGGGAGVPAFAAEFIPADATVTDHRLSFVPDPPCTNATVMETGFDTDAPDPPAPAGEKTARLDYAIVCVHTPCGGPNPQTTFSVIFTRPGGGGGSGLTNANFAGVSLLDGPARQATFNLTGNQSENVNLTLKASDTLDLLVVAVNGWDNPIPSPRLSDSAVIPAGTELHLTLRPTRKGRRVLKDKSKLAGKISFTFSDALGHEKTTTEKFVLRK